LADDRGRPAAFALTPGNVAFRSLPPSPDQSGCWPTKLTTPTACAKGSDKARSKQSFHRPPQDGRLIRSTPKPTNAETLSNACSAS
jgi:hypothetical protein